MRISRNTELEVLVEWLETGEPAGAITGPARQGWRIPLTNFPSALITG